MQAKHSQSFVLCTCSIQFTTCYLWPIFKYLVQKQCQSNISEKSPTSTKRDMHVTFLDPFLWYQLLKLAADHFSSPCLPNCILFFDSSEHPHQSLLLLQSHWLMALPVRQKKSQLENPCVSQERNTKKKEIEGSGTTEQYTT